MELDEIRLGKISRSNAIKIVKKYDGSCDPKYIKNFCEYIEISVEQFWSEISKINAGYKFYEKNQQKDKTTNFVRLIDALKMSEKLKFNLDLKQTGMAKRLLK